MDLKRPLVKSLPLRRGERVGGGSLQPRLPETMSRLPCLLPRRLLEALTAGCPQPHRLRPLAPCHCHRADLPPLPLLRPSRSSVTTLSFPLFTSVFSILITRFITFAWSHLVKRSHKERRRPTIKPGLRSPLPIRFRPGEEARTEMTSTCPRVSLLSSPRRPFSSGGSGTESQLQPGWLQRKKGERRGAAAAGEERIPPATRKGESGHVDHFSRLRRFGCSFFSFEELLCICSLFLGKAARVDPDDEELSGLFF